MSGLTRRRFLAVTAAGCAVPRLSAASPVATWRGQALGARAQIALAGLDPAEAAPIFRSVAQELSRIEGLFSLYRPDSALSRLNRDGVLPAPPPEFLELLSLARAVHAATEGAFDPTMQPLFVLHAECAADRRPAAPDEVVATLARVGFAHVRADPAAIHLGVPGMAMTLNGIAQGHAADRVSALLHRAGLHDVMVDTGEIRVSGTGGQGGWPVVLPGGRTVRLADRAVATSRLGGTLVDPSAGIGHIFDPTGARSALRPSPVTAFHDSAAMADAASTAAVVLDDARLPLLRALGVEIAHGPGAAP